MREDSWTAEVVSVSFACKMYFPLGGLMVVLLVRNWSSDSHLVTGKRQLVFVILTKRNIISLTNYFIIILLMKKYLKGMRSKSSSVFQALCIYTFNSHDHFPRLRFLKARQLPFHILIMRHDVFFP